METLIDTHYPKDLRENIIYRKDVLSTANEDDVFVAEIRELCGRDILFWINTFCYTKDPRKKPAILPFITYNYQDKHITEIKAAIDGQYDYLNDKSRDVGVSWDVLYVLMWFWLFHYGSDFRVGSRKEDFVDKLGDIDTLLEKVRFNLRYQPQWLLPAGFNLDKDAGYMKIINPANGNAIIGESANANFGSGGRRKALFLDEYAKWDPPIAESAWTSTADVSKCRIVVSTPVGSANKFAQLASGTKEKIKKTSLHWTLHPEKAAGAYYIDGQSTKIPVDSPEAANALWVKGYKIRSLWYDAECARRKDTDIAQELDIDYLRSGRPFFNMRSLMLQREWEPYVRSHPGSVIPYGKYIKAKLVDVDGKVEVREQEGGWLRIFELPEEGRQYVVSGDVSEGLAKGDESFIVVRDKSTRNVIAAANMLTDPDDLAVKINMVAKLYNKANEAVENNNHGYSVNSDLKGMDGNLYYSKTINEKTGEVGAIKAGWSTTAKTRPAMLDQMEEEIRQVAFEIRDPVLLAQCKTFVTNEKSGKPEADGNFLDDGVLACAIGGAVIKEFPYKATDRSLSRFKQKQLVREMSKTIGRF